MFADFTGLLEARVQVVLLAVHLVHKLIYFLMSQRGNSCVVGKYKLKKKQPSLFMFSFYFWLKKFETYNTKP